MYRLLLVAVLTITLLETGTACRPKADRLIEVGEKANIQWLCPPEQVLFAYKDEVRCFKKHADCPNGIFHESECHCFPGTSRNATGVCGQICKNCENGWCSSVSKCESCKTDFVWDPKSQICVPYETASPPKMNVRTWK